VTEIKLRTWASRDERAKWSRNIATITASELLHASTEPPSITARREASVETTGPRVLRRPVFEEIDVTAYSANNRSSLE
jgi:hypothetical protein